MGRGDDQDAGVRHGESDGEAAKDKYAHVSPPFVIEHHNGRSKTAKLFGCQVWVDACELELDREHVGVHLLAVLGQ